MLDLMGSEYVIDHVIAEHNVRAEQRVYRGYVTDVLKVIAESWGATISDRYADLVERKPQDTRTGDEIALDVIRRAGLKGKHDESI